ncbi:hypothetical protein IEI94_05710 [Halomonas sp. ML-15]|uniref:toxin-antitoxin system YwqK family antitoxin n=1 Tax=Halomonas sp. ML-15 TaxID=2773305 RepID=UPI001745DC08|nr:hypothetical protein [Halomonas sp. ML-15]MBD3895342.1 hypothetical protein [Halomonas sp. ML-15]
MKRFCCVLVFTLAFIPWLVLGEEGGDIQWIDADLMGVEEGDSTAAYYFEPPVADGELWSVILYYIDESDGDDPVVAYDVQLDNPDFHDAFLVGEYSRYYQDGSLHRVGTLDDKSRPHGTFTHYHRDGSYEVSEYRHGQRHGYRRDYHANDQLKHEQHFVDGEPEDGERVYYDENGEVTTRYWHVDGKLHGALERFVGGVLMLGEDYVDGQRHGWARRFTEEGEKVSEVEFVGGQRHGVERRWSDGQLTLESHYRHGQQHGQRQRWDDGVLIVNSSYVEGSRQGEAQFFRNDGTRSRYEYRDEDGQLIERREYGTDDQMTSLMIVEEGEYGPMTRQETYRDGALVRRRVNSEDRRWSLDEQFQPPGAEEPRYRRETVDREMHGRQVRPLNWPEGSTEIGEYDHGVPVGEHRHTDEDGNLIAGGRYENGHKVGEWITLSYESTVHENYDDEGRLHGERREVHEDGTQLVREHYRHGERHGDYIQRHAWNGHIIGEGEYRDGQRIGTWRVFNDSHQATFEGEYVDGEKDGLWVAHFEDGYERGRVRYDAGLPVGDHYIFTHDGAVELVSRYEEGRLHGEQLRYFEGTLSEVRRYRNGEPHGLNEFFLPDGERYMVSEYRDGVLLEREDEL